MPAIETTPELVRRVYATLERNLEVLRHRLDPAADPPGEDLPGAHGGSGN